MSASASIQRKDYYAADRRAIATWLMLCALLVAGMVVLGGYTRLSGSGLSITEWKPVRGALPPLSDSQWEEEFAAYRASPQYIKVNTGMTLPEFKSIFWPEFLHRLLGRLIGAAFLLPLVIFAARRSISGRLLKRLAGIFLLGGLQGLVGWLMVKSGLRDLPSVSHLRLALHLSIALAIYGLLLWTAMDVAWTRLKPSLRGGEADAAIQLYSCRAGSPRCARNDGFLRKTYIGWFLALCLQIVLGAFVAGLHAGLIYNTWPDMDGQMIPDGLLFNRPWYDNFIHNLTMIQFMHRNLAVIVGLSFAFWWNSARRHATYSGIRRNSLSVAGLIAVQFALGVFTLLHQAPLPLALAHQAAALLLLTAAILLLHRLYRTETE